MDAKIYAVLNELNRQQLQNLFIDTGTPYDDAEPTDALRSYMTREYERGDIQALDILAAGDYE